MTNWKRNRRNRKLKNSWCRKSSKTWRIRRIVRIPWCRKKWKRCLKFWTEKSTYCNSSSRKSIITRNICSVKLSWIKRPMGFCINSKKLKAWKNKRSPMCWKITWICVSSLRKPSKRSTNCKDSIWRRSKPTMSSKRRLNKWKSNPKTTLTS